MMELTYDNIHQWMKEYFETYSTYGQKLETADRMKDFFAPDLRFIPYIAAIGGPEGGFKSRDEFIQTAKSHPSWYERLIPDGFTIDERQKTVVVLFRMEVVDTKKNQVAIRKSALAHYELILDESNTIKIKTIRFFWEVMPEGFKEFYEVFGSD
jgi:hypothetical protein